MYFIKQCVSLVQPDSPIGLLCNVQVLLLDIIPEEIYLDFILFTEGRIEFNSSINIPVGVQTTKSHHLVFEILITF